MQEMLISKFKAKCIGALKEVKRTKKPLTVTLRGEPIAVVQPPPPALLPKQFGSQREAMTIKVELVGRDFANEWDMEK